MRILKLFKLGIILRLFYFIYAKHTYASRMIILCVYNKLLSFDLFFGLIYLKAIFLTDYIISAMNVIKHFIAVT